MILIAICGNFITSSYEKKIYNFLGISSSSTITEITISILVQLLPGQMQPIYICLGMSSTCIEQLIPIRM